MPSKLKTIVTNFSYVIISNLLTVLVSSIVVLILPKIMGVEEYGYWQLYIFYLDFLLQFMYNKISFYIGV